MTKPTEKQVEFALKVLKCGEVISCDLRALCLSVLYDYVGSEFPELARTYLENESESVQDSISDNQGTQLQV